MSKTSISHRYDIEYVHPDLSKPGLSSKQKPSKNWLLLSIFLGALVLISAFLFNGRNIPGFFQNLFTNETANKIEVSPVSAIAKINTPEKNTNPPISSQTQTIEQLKPSPPLTAKVKELTATSKIETNNNTNMADDIDRDKTAENSTKNQPKVDEDAALLIERNAPENAALIDSLDMLTEQLSAEIQKNTELEKKLKENTEENQEDEKKLSALLSKSLYPATEKKQYLSALESIAADDKKQASASTEEQTEKNEIIVVNNKKLVLNKQIADSKVTAAIEATEEEKQRYSNNAISLNMKSQVDAIILAMQAGGLSSSKPQKRNKKKPTPPPVTTGLQSQNDDLINQLSQQIEKQTNDTQKSDDLAPVDLQGKLDQLIVSKGLASSDYKEALSQESATRTNAVRSIVVKKGETLWSIAKRAYGNGLHYKKIIKANPQLTRQKNFQLIIGQVIRVPE